ncbi:extensin family protein [Bdellovibrio bacteriovorus]
MTKYKRQKPFLFVGNLNLKHLAGLLSLAFLVSCAGADDGEWASGEPDSTETVSETPQQDTAPSEDDAAAAIIAPDHTLHFSFFEKTVKLAHGPGKTWNGCDPLAMVRGGYNSTKCGNGTVHPNYAEHLNKYFFGCVEKGASVAGYAKPERVFISHYGTYANRNARNSTKLSMHAYARAIDIKDFILYDRDKKTTKVSTNVKDFKGSTAKFYNAFRQCWKDTLPSKCRPGQREYSGSIGIPGSAMGGNSLHNDHIHLSFPLCAG